MQSIFVKILQPRVNARNVNTAMLREQSFLILGNGAEDFRQGYETFLHHFVGVQNFKSNFYGVQNYFA